MFRIVTAVMLSLVLVACGEQETQQKSETDFKIYSAAEFFDTTSFSSASSAGFSFSQNNISVLINSDESGVYNAYAVDLNGELRTALTHSTTSAVYGLSYFPSDDRLLYTADNGGDEQNHIWVMELNGEAKDLTATENTKANFMGWSADRSEFYVTTNERDPRAFDLYKYSASNYDREIVFENTSALSVSSISPNDRWLALVKSRTSADSDVYLVDLEADDGTTKLVTSHEGNISYGVYDFSPDSSQLILSSDENGEWNEAIALNIASGDMSVYQSANWDISYVAFSSTGQFRVTGINNDAQVVVTIEDLIAGSEVSLPPLPDGNIRNIRFDLENGKMAFLLNSDTSPSDLYVLDIAQGQASRLTTALSESINQDHLVEAEVVRYESFDGTLIPSILYRPKQASVDNKVPAVVFVHGGPGGQTRRGYSALIQHLVSNGYAVLGANNRGSSGYGKTFFHMDDKRHGEGDLQDIVQGRTYLESLNWVDGDKIGIIGGSYGGFMVAAALAFEPEVFDVGIDIFGVTNWERTLKSIPPHWESFRESLFDEMGDPATDAERHHRISPLFYADQIVKPTLVIQGANDVRVLQVESDELVAAIEGNGVPVEYIVFPDEGHGFRGRHNRITASETYLSFLDKYLLQSGPASD